MTGLRKLLSLCNEYEKAWHCKGSISVADGMLYCYEEKRGNLALVEHTPEDFKVVSSFRITKGSGPSLGTACHS